MGCMYCKILARGSSCVGATCVATYFSYLLYLQVDLRSVVSLLTRQPFSKYPKWLKYFLVRAIILITFATVFMAVRLKLNQGMPKFTR